MSAEVSQQPDGGNNKSSSVTLVFMSPDKLCAILCPLADHMANVTAGGEDGAHGLFSARTTDQGGFSYLWSISSPFRAFPMYLSNFILSDIYRTIPVD